MGYTRSDTVLGFKGQQTDSKILPTPTDRVVVGNNATKRGRKRKNTYFNQILETFYIFTTF